MSINTLYPTIKPSLMLDFANTKRLDPRITFTRTTTATYYDGKTTTKAEENLLLRSQDYSATWTVTDLTPVTGKTAPDGTSTATEFTAGASNAVLTQGYTAVAGSYTFSVWLRRVTGSGNIEIAADNGTWTVKTITGTWARYDVTQTVAAGSKTAGVRVTTNTDAIEVWGAQLEQRASVTDYIPTTTQAITTYVPTLLTAAAGVPRFEHNPVTGESLGLLVESARTNLTPYSEQFDEASWAKSNASVRQNIAISPDGLLGADALIENASNAVHTLVRTSITIVANTTCTFSCYAKKLTSGANRFLRLTFQNGATTNGFRSLFNLSTGSVVSISGQTVTAFGSGTATSASITEAGGGWYRCSITGVVDATTTAATASLFMQSVGTTFSATYTGDGYSGILLWGAQVEQAEFSSSYIPTTTATVTRNADALSMTGTNFSSWYNAAEGTLFADINPRALGVTSGFQLNDNTTDNRIRLATNSTSDQGLITTDGSAQATLDGGTPAANTNMKLALAYKANDFALSLDGGTVATDTAGTVPVVNQLQIGAETSTVGNVTVRKIAYYPIRCTNTQLQAITT